jgi:hypothetical protein
VLRQRGGDRLAAEVVVFDENNAGDLGLVCASKQGRFGRRDRGLLFRTCGHMESLPLPCSMGSRKPRETSRLVERLSSITASYRGRELARGFAPNRRHPCIFYGIFGYAGDATYGGVECSVRRSDLLHRR